MRSRTETMRKRRASRRRKLVLANAALLAAICAVVAWNVWAASPDEEPGAAAIETAEETAQERPADAEAHAEAPAAEPAESEESTEPVEQVEQIEPAEPVETPAEEAPVEQPADGEARPTVKLAFVGDVLLGEYVGDLMERNGFDYPYVHAAEVIRSADVAVANLETAVTDRDIEKPGEKTYEFKSDPDALPAFRDAGFDAVNLANNHTMDFGPDGLRDTMRHLEENGIVHVGAGETAEEAYAPEYIEKNGLRIALFGFSHVIPDVCWKVGARKIGLAETYDYTKPVEAIEKAAAEADLVVVMAHWGDELQEQPHPTEQVELARRFVDAGADLVVGSHPHVLQGFERYGGGWIAYSLGNFIFTTSKEPLTYDSAVLLAECGRGGDCRLTVEPFRADTPQPKPMDAARSAQVLARLSSLSIGAEVRSNGTVAEKEAE